MRERKVDAARVNVQRLAEVLHRHHGALDVPTRAARAKRRLPSWLSVFSRLPQHEVARVGFIVFVDIHARTGANAAEIVVRKLSVTGEIGDAVIDRAFAHVGKTALAEFLNRRHHIGDVLGRVHQALRPFQPQRVHIFVEGLGVDLRVFLDRVVLSRGVADDLVLNVRDVHHVIELISARAEPPAQDVLERECSQISNVDVVVYGRPARVHPHGVVQERSERLRLLCEGVIEPQGHSRGLFLYRTPQD